MDYGIKLKPTNNYRKRDRDSVTSLPVHLKIMSGFYRDVFLYFLAFRPVFIRKKYVLVIITNETKLNGNTNILLQNKGVLLILIFS